MPMVTAPMFSNQAGSAVVAPKVAVPAFPASNRKANEISTPPATMNGMKWDTPDIKWTYAEFCLCIFLSLSVLEQNEHHFSIQKCLSNSDLLIGLLTGCTLLFLHR